MNRILYRFLTTLARLAVRSGRSNDIEIIVLRHQLRVLRRQHERPTLNNDDRSLLAAIGQALPATCELAGSSHQTLCLADTADASPNTGLNLLRTLDVHRPAPKSASHHSDGHR